MTPSGVIIAAGWTPGLIGDIAAAHALYYAREWNFGPPFETKVARELAGFIDRYDPARDCILAASLAGVFAGSLTIDGSDPLLAPGQSHLRWFIVTDGSRGHGVGKQLMDAGMAFVRDAGFDGCYLTTFAGLDAARLLYERAGFQLVSEAASMTWGTAVVEQRFEWQRGGGSD